MKKKKRNILLSILIGAFLLCAVAGGTFYYYLFAPQFHPSKTVYIYAVPKEPYHFHRYAL